MQSFVVWFLFLFGTAIYAQGNHRVEFYLSSSKLNYTEYALDEAVLDTEDSDFGDIGGFTLCYSYGFFHKQNSFFELDFFYKKTQGNSDYVGAVLGSDAPYGSYRNTTKNKIYDYGLQLNYIHRINQLFGYRLLFGLAKHKWQRDLLPTQSEVYEWMPLMFGVGGDLHLDVGYAVVFHGALKYNYNLAATMNLSTTQTDFALGRVENFITTLGFTCDLTKDWQVVFDYEFNLQSIYASDVVQTPLGLMYEPRSKDKQQHLNIGLGYSF